MATSGSISERELERGLDLDQRIERKRARERRLERSSGLDHLQVFRLRPIGRGWHLFAVACSWGGFSHYVVASPSKRYWISTNRYRPGELFCDPELLPEEQPEVYREVMRSLWPNPSDDEN